MQNIKTLSSSDNQQTISRRDALTKFRYLLCSASALSLSPLCLGDTDIKALQLNLMDTPTSLTLIQVCRLLFPHNGLSDHVYLNVIRDIEKDTVQSESTHQMIQGATELLHQKTGSNWLEASLEKQLETLTEIQESELFRYLHTRTIESLYRNPEVWKLIGYEGSSIEYGGYLHRGFDDIDWLQEK